MNVYNSEFEPIVLNIQTIKDESKNAKNVNATILNQPNIIGLDEFTKPIFEGFVEGFQDAKNLWKTHDIGKFTAKVQDKIETFKNDKVIFVILPKYLSKCVLVYPYLQSVYFHFLL